ncbi:unnamed protein product [Symbiodinium sp. CCMP2592]|nr:unnamed protein product [Symbiodinium sp. CCMP2592]
MAWLDAFYSDAVGMVVKDSTAAFDKVVEDPGQVQYNSRPFPKIGNIRVPYCSAAKSLAILAFREKVSVENFSGHERRARLSACATSVYIENFFNLLLRKTVEKFVRDMGLQDIDCMDLHGIDRESQTAWNTAASFSPLALMLAALVTIHRLPVTACESLPAPLDFIEFNAVALTSIESSCSHEPLTVSLDGISAEEVIEGAAVAVTPIQPGDFLILGTDGLFDNLSDFDVQRVVEGCCHDAVGRIEELEETAAALVDLAIRSVRLGPDAAAAKPWTRSGVPANNADDTTALVAVVQPQDVSSIDVAGELHIKRAEAARANRRRNRRGLMNACGVALGRGNADVANGRQPSAGSRHRSLSVDPASSSEGCVIA